MQSVDLISGGFFLSMLTHHCKMFEGTRFWEEVNYVSFRLKSFWKLIIKSLWRWRVRGLKEIIACLPSIIPFQGKWNSLLSVMQENMLFSMLIQRWSNVPTPCIETLNIKFRAFTPKHMVENILLRTSSEPTLIFYQRTLNYSSQLGTYM